MMLQGKIMFCVRKNTINTLSNPETKKGNTFWRKNFSDSDGPA